MGVMPAAGQLLGMEAPALVQILARSHRSLASMLFVEYRPGPGIEERLPFQPTGSIEDMRADKLLRATPRVRPLVRELLRHDSQQLSKNGFEVSTAELLTALNRRHPDGTVLALCSRCTLRNRRTVHIPLMDFRVPPGREALASLKRVLGTMNVHGAILESGRSYHFYGFDLVDPDQWLQFMARCLLLVPLTDTRYIGHRLLEGTGVLRLTTCTRKPKVPVVVACV